MRNDDSNLLERSLESLATKKDVRLHSKTMQFGLHEDAEIRYGVLSHKTLHDFEFKQSDFDHTIIEVKAASALAKTGWTTNAYQWGDVHRSLQPLPLWPKPHSLRKDISDVVERLMLVVRHDAISDWMERPNSSLGGISPLDAILSGRTADVHALISPLEGMGAA